MPGAGAVIDAPTMASRSTIALGCVAGALFVALALIFAGAYPSTRDAPLRCSINALPSNATIDDVSRLCGAPYTSNVSFVAGIQIDQWVYDAGTFLTFRNGALSFMKIDHRHDAEQLRLRKPREILVMHDHHDD